MPKKPPVVVVPLDEFNWHEGQEEPKKSLTDQLFGKPETICKAEFQPTSPKPLKLTQQELERILDLIDDDDVSESLREVYLAVIAARTQIVQGELGIGIDFSIPDVKVLQWLKQEAGQHIQGINQTTRTKVRKALVEAAAEGEGMMATSERISDVFKEAKGSRSEMIARTETMSASNWSAQQSYEDSEVVEFKEWLLAPDYDPSEDDGHCEEVAASGPVPLDDDFGDGFPFPPAHINCRCSIAPIVHGDLNRYRPLAGDSTTDRLGREGNRAEAATEAVNEEFDKMKKDYLQRLEDRLREEAKFTDDDLAMLDFVVGFWVGGGEKLTVQSMLAGGPDVVTGTFIEPREPLKRYAEFNQKVLRDLVPGEKITLYRGINDIEHGPKLAKQADEAFREGRQVMVDFSTGDPISRLLNWATSWTSDPDVAAKFTNSKTGKEPGDVIIRADIPIKDIVLTPLTAGNVWPAKFRKEREFVVLSRGPMVVFRQPYGEGEIEEKEFDERYREDFGIGPLILYIPTGQHSWHYPGAKPVSPVVTSKRYHKIWSDPVARQHHITALGVRHMQLERHFQGRMKRTFQEQENQVLRYLRRVHSDSN